MHSLDHLFVGAAPTLRDTMARMSLSQRTSPTTTLQDVKIDINDTASIDALVSPRGQASTKHIKILVLKLAKRWFASVTIVITAVLISWLMAYLTADMREFDYTTVDYSRLPVYNVT